MVSVRIMLSSWEPPIVSVYRNRTDDLRITWGLVPRSQGMTCTDDTADRALGADCIGVSLPLVPRPVPRVIPVMRSERRSPFDRPSLGYEQRDARLWHLGRSLVTLLASGTGSASRVRRQADPDRRAYRGKLGSVRISTFRRPRAMHMAVMQVFRAASISARGYAPPRDISSSNEGGG